MSTRGLVLSLTLLTCVFCSGNEQQDVSTEVENREENRTDLQTSSGENVLKLNDGQDLFPSMPVISEKDSTEPSIVINWPAEAGLKNSLVEPPCPAQNGFTNHPYQDPKCLGFLRVAYRAGPIQLYYNSGVTEEYIGVKGLQHSFRFEIRTIDNNYYLQTPVERMALVAGSAENTLAFANSIYGDTVFTKIGDTYTAEIGGSTWTFSKLAGEEKYPIQTISHPLMQTVFSYDSQTKWTTKVEVSDLRVGGKTEAIIFDYSGLAANGLVIFKQQSGDLQAKVTVTNGSVSLIERMPENTKIEVVSQTINGKTFPIGFFSYAKARRTAAVYNGLDREGHLLFEKSGDNSLSYSYGVDGVHRYTRWTDRFNRSNTVKYKAHDTYFLPVSFADLSGVALRVYEENLPFRLTRSFNPLQGWTDVSYLGQDVTTTFPDLSYVINKKLPNGSRTESSDGTFSQSITEVSRTGTTTTTVTGGLVAFSNTTTEDTPQFSRITTTIVNELGYKIQETIAETTFYSDGSRKQTIKDLIAKNMKVTFSNSGSIFTELFRNLNGTGVAEEKTETNFTETAFSVSNYLHGALVEVSSGTNNNGVFTLASKTSNFFGKADSASSTTTNSAGEYRTNSWASKADKNIPVYSEVQAGNKLKTSVPKANLTNMAASRKEKIKVMALALNGGPESASGDTTTKETDKVVEPCEPAPPTTETVSVQPVPPSDQPCAYPTKEDCARDNGGVPCNYTPPGRTDCPLPNSFRPDTNTSTPNENNTQSGPTPEPTSESTPEPTPDPTPEPTGDSTPGTCDGFGSCPQP